MATAALAALDDPGTWTDDEPLECCAVVPEAPDVATISFVSPSGAWFRYQPGQFVTLELPLPRGTIWRTYTISSSPSRPLTLGITVKAAPGSIGRCDLGAGVWMARCGAGAVARRGSPATVGSLA